MTPHVFAKDLAAAFESGTGDISVATADGSILQAHSMVLLFSPVLRAQLEGTMREAQTKQIIIDYPERAVRTFLIFLYQGRLLNGRFQSLEDVSVLVEMCDYYDLLRQVADAFIDIMDHVLTLLTSKLPGASDLEAARILKPIALLQAGKPDLCFDQAFRALPVCVGRNSFLWACNLRALGLWESFASLTKDDALDVSSPQTVFQTDICEETLHAVLAEHPGIDPFEALPEYVEWVVSRVNRRRPKVGSHVFIDGKACLVVKDDRSKRPFEVIDTAGSSLWYEQDKLVMPSSLCLSDLAVASLAVARALRNTNCPLPEKLGAPVTPATL